MPTTERVHSRRCATVALTVLLLVSTPVDVLASTTLPGTESVDSTPTTTEEAPKTSAPPTTAPDTAPPDTVVGEEAPDEGASTLTWIAIIATVGLLGVAAWWMVRKSRQSGPVNRMDDDWPGDSEVI